MQTISKNLYITVRDIESDSVIKMVTTDNGDIILELANKATFKMALLQEALNDMKEFLGSRQEMDKIYTKLGEYPNIMEIEIPASEKHF